PAAPRRSRGRPSLDIKAAAIRSRRAGSDVYDRVMVRFAILATVAWTRVAAAGPHDADDAFKRGHDLMDAGKLAEACAAFEVSLQLDFQYGTLYNLATCEERRGHIAAAWRMYKRLAAEDTNSARGAHAGELAASLSPRVPRIILEPHVPPPGLVVAL